MSFLLFNMWSVVRLIYKGHLTSICTFLFMGLSYSALHKHWNTSRTSVLRLEPVLKFGLWILWLIFYFYLVNLIHFYFRKVGNDNTLTFRPPSVPTLWGSSSDCSPNEDVVSAPGVAGYSFGVRWRILGPVFRACPTNTFSSWFTGYL